MRLTRRQLLGSTGALGASSLLASCGGFSTSGSKPDAGSDTLTFTTWGTDAELKAFRKAIDGFQQANSSSKVALNAVPYEQMFTNIDAQLQAGNPPDIFRVPYYTFGGYAGRDQLLDLSSHLPSGFSDRFTPTAWSAVQNEAKPFGVPHHTDTSVILYNKDALDAAGISSVPTSADEAWNWDELTKVAETLRKALPKDKYPFAYNWQGNGVTRWLSWLFQADGRFLDPDLTKSAIDSDAGRAAVDFTKSFFPSKFVPPNDSVKSTTYASDMWYSQNAAMTWAGAFLIPDAESTLDFEWGATFSPRKVRGGGDFGGNALVATKQAKNPELVASFLDYLTQPEQMTDFCATSSLLPTRQDLTDNGIEFDVRPELAPTFLGQAKVVRPEDAGQVASPVMTKIITVLKDQLEQAFVGGQSTEDTIKKLSTGIGEATAS